MRKWKIVYNDWIITHDPNGILACYCTLTDSLEWCYFGDTLEEIKFAIDERNYYWKEAGRYATMD